MRHIWRYNRETRRLEELCPQSAPELHYVIDDIMDQQVHPATGRPVDSKSTFRRITRNAGLTEVGDSYERTPWQFQERTVDPSQTMRQLSEHPEAMRYAMQAMTHIEQEYLAKHKRN